MSDSLLITIFCVLYAITVLSSFALMTGPRAAKVRWRSHQQREED